MLIAFTGKMGSGKTTAIQTISRIDMSTVQIMAKFAQPLYDMQELIYDRIRTVYRRPETFVKDRKLLQWLGTEWGRGTISDSLWIDLWKAKSENHAHGLVMCDDVRFDNEAEAVHSLGGAVIQLIGPSRGAAPGISGHASEAGIKPELIDFTIHNTGTKEEFEAQVAKVYAVLLTESTINSLVRSLYVCHALLNTNQRKNKMAFKPVVDLDAENSISIGGADKKTGKKNPTSVEGYYLGSKTTESKFGPSKLHILQTPKGNVGVWGKTDMNRKLGGVPAGTMVRVTYTGEVPSNKGNPMKKFKVEVDEANCINVDHLAQETANTAGADSDYSDTDLSYGDDAGDQDLDADEQAPDEVPPVRAQPPRQAAQAPTAERQKRVQDLLNRSKRAS